MSIENDTPETNPPQTLEDIEDIGLPEGANDAIDEGESPVIDDSPPVVDDAPTVSEEPVDEVKNEEPPVSEDSDDEPETEAPKAKPVQRTPQSVQDEFPSTSAPRDIGEERIAITSDFNSAIAKAMEDLPNLNLVNNEEMAKWGRALANALDTNTINERFRKTLENNDALFTQGIVEGGKRLDGAAPRLQSTGESQTYKGERGVVRLMNFLGQGTLYQVPLWHSGFWITFKAPSDSEIIELHRKLIADKIDFGRQTYGLTFSNELSYTVDRLVDFALSHVYNLTVRIPENSKTDLRELISSNDIFTLIWGVVCAMYPNGFQIDRPCASNPDKCNHILTETLNVRKLLRVDSKAFTQRQRTHMTSRGASSMSLESVKLYQEEMLKTHNKAVEIESDNGRILTITLGVPNVAEYIQSGYRWISEMVEMVEAAATDADSDQDKNEIIYRHVQATMMRQYGHWVKEIEFDGDNIEESESNEDALTVLSMDNKLRNKFMEAIGAYIDESAVSVIGIPVYTCPSCGTDQAEYDNNYRFSNEIIPIDVVNTFFDLIVGRLRKIAER